MSQPLSSDSLISTEENNAEFSYSQWVTYEFQPDFIYRYDYSFQTQSTLTVGTEERKTNYALNRLYSFQLTFYTDENQPNPLTVYLTGSIGQIQWSETQRINDQQTIRTHYEQGNLLLQNNDTPLFEMENPEDNPYFRHLYLQFKQIEGSSWSASYQTETGFTFHNSNVLMQNLFGRFSGADPLASLLPWSIYPQTVVADEAIPTWLHEQPIHQLGPLQIDAAYPITTKYQRIQSDSDAQYWDLQCDQSITLEGKNAKILLPSRTEPLPVRIDYLDHTRTGNGTWSPTLNQPITYSETSDQRFVVNLSQGDSFVDAFVIQGNIQTQMDVDLNVEPREQ